MIKTNRWIIGLDGSYISTPSKPLTGFSDNTEEIILIAPFDTASAVSFGVGNEHRTTTSQYMMLSMDSVSDWVEETETFGSVTYQDIADWHVWRIALKAPTKAYVSKFRGGFVYFSFRVGTIGLNSKCLTDMGTFGADNLLPTTGQTTGDYYACEDLTYTLTVDTKNDVPLVFGYGMYTYWGSGEYWVKVAENKVLNTVSHQQAVDPSFAVNDEVDEDEINYLVSFESVIYDHEARIDQAEIDIQATEDLIDDIIAGTQALDKIVLTDLEIDKAYVVDKVTRLETAESDIDDLETFMNTTVPATYETIENVALKEDKANKGVAGGYPELDESGKVPLAQTYGTLNDLQDAHVVGVTPYAVDWLSLTEGGSALTPESGNWYHVVTVGDYQGESYRWSGSAYVLVSSDLILGETSNTAYRGDRGKTAYDHSQINDGSNPHGTTFANIASKPTTIAGYGIGDAYTKEYIDGLQDNNGWEQTLLGTLTNAQTLVTATLAGYDEVRFICKNLTTGEVDTDIMVGNLLVNGTKIVFFDDADVYFYVGTTDSTFTEDNNFELKVYGVTMTQQLAENIATDFDGTNYLDDEETVEDSLIKLDTELKAVDTKVVGLDTPISELNGNTLREVFENRNIAMPDLTGKTEISAGVYRLLNLSGVTIDYKVSSGEFIINGTSTAVVEHYITQSLNITENTYASAIYVSGTFTSIEIDNISLFTQPYSNDKVLTFKTSNSITFIGAFDILKLQLRQGQVFNDYKFKLQLEKGSTATPYQVPTNGPYNDIDISTFGLTNAQIDYWYSVYSGLLNNSVVDTAFKLINEKANIAQESWYTPTLTTATSTYIKYRKNTLNRVVLEGNITVTTAGANLTLPTGYRPLTTLYIPLVKSDGTFGYATLATTGVFTTFATGTFYVNVSFETI